MPVADHRELWTVVWYCIVNSLNVQAEESDSHDGRLNCQAESKSPADSGYPCPALTISRAMSVSLELFGVQDINLKLLPIYISISYVRLRP